MQRRDAIGRIGRAVIAGAALTMPRIARAAIQWTAYSAQPAGSASIRGLTRLAASLAAGTNGAFVLKVQPLGTVAVNGTNLPNAVAAGTIDLAEDPFYSLPVPAAGLMRLPMLVNSAADYAIAATAMRPYLQTALAGREVVFLGTARFAAQCLWSRRPVERMDDMTGQRIRLAAPEQGELVRRYNGVSVTMAATEMTDAFESGRINASFTAASTAQSPWKSSLTAAFTGYQGFFDSAFIANPRSFERLDSAWQALLLKSMDDATAWIVATRDAEEQAARATLRKAGAVITEGTPADLTIATARLAPYWDEWAIPRGRDAVERVAAVRKALAR
jgi:TRAP-type C4-dicarboxylate transport system substrate-binding protein